ncbi:unnamed protein product [Orchesella dallaii]|uniref:Uncharacterized protein n=1 Tax=Orchesella dallaii TaxID=48710 RepID=A0ABP1Q5U4_9HEXA
MDVDGNNPFLKEKVIEAIVRVADIEDLKTLRLVSKLLWKKSLSRWRQHYRIIIHCGKPDMPPMNGVSTLESFLELNKLPGDPFKLVEFPFKHYHLHCVLVDLASDEGQYFWNKFGPLMTTLEVSFATVTFESADQFDELLFKKTRNLESLFLNRNWYGTTRPKPMSVGRVVTLKKEELQRNLKELKISAMDFQDVKSMDDCKSGVLPLTWFQILAPFPNVEALELCNIECDRFKVGGLTKCLQGFKELLSSGNNLSYKKLSIVVTEGMKSPPVYDTFPDEAVKLFSLLRLPLTDFTFDIGIFTKEKVLQTIYQLHAKTLQKLTIFRCPKLEPFPNFPFDTRLNNLTEFRVSPCIVPDLEFLNLMPNLKILHTFEKDREDHIHKSRELGEFWFFSTTNLLNGSESKDQDGSEEVPWNIKKLPQLEEFIHGVEFCKPRKVVELAKIMPNLKRLRLQVDNIGFSVICKLWKGLEELDIRGSRMNEKGFIGIVSGSQRTFANVTHLTELRCLKTGRNYYPVDGKIQDFGFALGNKSVFKGILQLPNLQTLVAECDQEITDEAYNTLIAKFPAPGSQIKRRSAGALPLTDETVIALDKITGLHVNS